MCKAPASESAHVRVRFWQLTPKWEELANKLRHVVKVAYVDTEAGPTPNAIGQIQGTPTIKAFIPKRSSAKNEKIVVDYDQSREVDSLMRYATSKMPSFVEVLDTPDVLRRFEAKATEWGLPRVLVLSNKAGGQSASTLKALSAEYRRRVLIGEVRSSKLPEVAKRHGVTSYPTLLCFASGGAAAPTSRFEGKEPTYRRLDGFVGKCALRKPVLKKPADEKEEL